MMPAIIHDRWGGLFPRLEPLALPPMAAVVAKNVDLGSGKLRPASFTNPFQRLHDDDGKMVGQLTEQDILSIDKPTAPAVQSNVRMITDPRLWVTAWLGLWVTAIYIDDDGIAWPVEDTIYNAAMTYSRTEYKEDGFVLTFTVPTATFALPRGVLFKVWGPCYKLVFTADGHYRGGPETSGTYPETFDWTVPQWPSFSKQLAWPTSMVNYVNSGSTWGGTRYPFADLSLVDVNGPVCSPEVYIDGTILDDSVTVTFFKAGEVQIYFRVNYYRNTRRFYYYARTYVDARVARGELRSALSPGVPGNIKLTDFEWDDDDIPDTGLLLLGKGTASAEFVAYTSWTKHNPGAANEYYQFETGTEVVVYAHAEDAVTEVIDEDTMEMEGPPSDASTIVEISPGEIAKLYVPRTVPPYVRQKIYRSTNTSPDGFGLLDVGSSPVASDMFYDDLQEEPTDQIPAWGNYPNDTLAEAMEGSVIHPNQWAAIVYGNELRPSDIYRLHAYPDEFAVPFPTNIMAIALAGGSIIVFTEANATTGEQGKVFQVVGSHPAHLAIYDVANVSPLLVKTSICRIDGAIYYASRDGLMRVGSGAPQLVSEPFFSRDEWTLERPDLMQAWVNDRNVFLIVNLTGNNNLRFDLGAKEATVTRFTRVENVEEFEWKSRPFDFGQLTTLTAVQIVADSYPVTLLLYNEDNVLCGTRQISSRHPEKLPKMPPSRFWSYRVRSLGNINRIAIGTSTAEIMARS